MQRQRGVPFAPISSQLQLIRSSEKVRRIFGLTKLNHDMYVYHGGDTDIKVYDLETSSVPRSLQVPGLGSVIGPNRFCIVNDLTSCKIHQCIYIADCINNVIHRVEIKDTTITQWPVYDEPESLSVNSVGNVLVTFEVVRKLKEFTTDGQLVREIHLESSIVHPTHTVELTPGQLVVCWIADNNTVPGVCIIDLSGKILQSYASTEFLPLRLAVNAVIYVVGIEDDHVLMLSPSLQSQLKVATNLKNPDRIWLDNQKGKMLIADNGYRQEGFGRCCKIKVYHVLCMPH